MSDFIEKELPEIIYKLVNKIHESTEKSNFLKLSRYIELEAKFTTDIIIDLDFDKLNSYISANESHK